MIKLFKAGPFFLLFFCFSLSLSLSAQNNFFVESKEADINKTDNKRRVIFPDRYKMAILDVAGIKNFLWSVSSEKNIANRKDATVLELPMPDGKTARYNIWESAVMEQALADKYPTIKTFTGQGIDDPSSIIKFDFTEQGFHAMIMSDINGSVYIDPYQQGDVSHYLVYFKKDLRNDHSFVENEDQVLAPAINDFSLNRTMAGPCVGTQLRTYRIAVAATGEYTNFHGGNVGAGLSAIVTALNRINGIYERELSVRMVLVANNNLIVYTNAATDPYSNNDGAAMLGENQATIDNVIGNANYDFGHVFSTGGGGIATVGGVCVTGFKSRGVTGLTSPTGDAFYVDYVAHEMGHQFNARHTFNANTGNCGGSNGSSTSNAEPGSGSTIMAYAGICAAANNLQANSDPFFHAVSMDEINVFTATGNGSNCAVLSATGNAVPVVMAGSDYNIPKSTPFILTGSATDANGDVLTYSWEQVDVGSEFGNWNTQTTLSPLFRSFIPTAIPERSFPKLSDIINNTTTIGEVLPSLGRNINMRLTARDNRAGGAGVCYDEMKLTVDANSGPFVVNVPSATGISWNASDLQLVTWDVANTNNSPVSCSNVSIQLSLDGGLTFPITLLASTPNDGSAQVVVPNNQTTQARIRVMAAGNVFYDMSNNNFTIAVPVATFSFDDPAPVSIACAGPATASVNLNVISILGYSTAVTLSATSGVPAGTTVSFTVNPVVPGNSTVVTLNNANTLSNGTYNITITGVSGAITKTRVISFIVQAGVAPVISLQPASLAVCAGSNVVFNVAATGVSSYQWQLSTDAGVNYNNIPGATSSTLTLTATTSLQNNNRYRVVLTNQCNSTISNAAILTVYPLPVVTLTASRTKLLPGLTATLTATTLPATGVTVSWFKNGVLLPAVTGKTLTVDVTGFGDYKVTIIDGNGCSNESQVVTITTEPSSKLFIYPSPSKGVFTVAYFNSNGGTTQRSVTIYDSKGAKVYNSQFTIAGPYQLLSINLERANTGIYYVVVGDASGKKLIDGKVMVY